MCIQGLWTGSELVGLFLLLRPSVNSTTVLANIWNANRIVWLVQKHVNTAGSALIFLFLMINQKQTEFCYISLYSFLPNSKGQKQTSCTVSFKKKKHVRKDTTCWMECFILATRNDYIQDNYHLIWSDKSITRMYNPTQSPVLTPFL